MTNEQSWLQLQENLQPYKSKLAEVATTVRDEDVSNYPIFLAYPEEEQTIGVGLPLFRVAGRGQNAWALHLTTLEELVSKQVVRNEKVDDFRTLYKKSEDALCLLIFVEGEARFGFLPIKENK